MLRDSVSHVDENFFCLIPFGKGFRYAFKLIFHCSMCSNHLGCPSHAFSSVRFQTTMHGELEYASQSQTCERTFLASGSFRRGFQMYIKISNPLFDALQASWMPFQFFQTTVHGELEYASRSQTRGSTSLAPDSFRRCFQRYIKISNPLFDAL